MKKRILAGLTASVLAAACAAQIPSILSVSAAGSYDMQLKIQLDGRLERYLDAAREVCTRQGAAVCDCYAKWKLLSQNGVDTTALLANGINHPSREMAWMFAYSLLETMMR